MIGLREYDHAAWFTRPNQDRTMVMLVGVGKSLIAVVSFFVGAIPVGVMLRHSSYSMLGT